MAIPVRPMGSQGMQASMQGYGCMGLTAFYGKPLSDEAACEVLQRAFDLGVRHFDTAERYACKGEDGTRIYNESVVGKFAAKVGKENITIATKYFPAPEEKAECKMEQVRESLEASLERLGLDCVDLYYLHRIPSNEALKSFMESASTLVKEGKCKYLGISEATPAQIRAAHAIHPLTAVQQEWSLLIRNLEEEVVPTCRELGIAVVAYSPLCRGLTSGAVKSQEDWSKIGNEGGAAMGFQTTCPHLSGDNLAANAKLLEPLEATAAELGVTPAQLSLAWVQTQGEDVFPIPGTTKIANLESNVGAVKLALEKADACKSVGASVDFTKVAGDRYPEALMARCFDKNL
eukprot:CAMPEP_0171062664 /NCGR_PEP_ID=MMETSP0766_2-20121228/5174_1 /TAXON_ID=439317 /ORGANISM="Gambierdiscus australes, Strain CAWD 149" /LENGTH=346 /DNA_ID=CAMNT_0011518467 /DNA_START=58 /DNA_END=1098 /DNA_ORIENTATION=+